MDVVLYHANCWDGLGAAWAAWLTLRDGAEYIPVQYGDPVPDLLGYEHVYIVDFAYSLEQMQTIAEGGSLTVIDHHKTHGDAVEALDGPGVTTVFDLKKSGAVLTWEHFSWDCSPDMPPLLRYIQDRDLWTWALPRSREVNAWIRSCDPTIERQPGAYGSDGVDFEFISAMAARIESADGLAEVIASGKSLLRHIKKTVRIICEGARLMPVVKGGPAVPVVNSCVYQSEIGHKLCSLFPSAPYACVYFDQHKYEGSSSVRVYSLRSDDREDVGEVARGQGGGGHPNAAGFRRALPLWSSLL